MWASLVLTLIVGMGMGIALDRLALGRDGDLGDRRGRGERLSERLAEELHLTPEQRAQVDASIAASRDQARELWRESQTSFEALRNEFRHEIRALLEPEQQARFDEMVRRDDERRRRREQRR